MKTDNCARLRTVCMKTDNCLCKAVRRDEDCMHEDRLLSVQG